jgi:hypothetical protein
MLWFSTLLRVRHIIIVLLNDLMYCIILSVMESSQDDAVCVPQSCDRRGTYKGVCLSPDTVGPTSVPSAPVSVPSLKPKSRRPQTVHPTIGRTVKPSESPPPSEYFTFRSCINPITTGFTSTCYGGSFGEYYRRSFATQSNGYATGVDKINIFLYAYDNLQDCTNKINLREVRNETVASQCGYGTQFVFQGLRTGLPTTAGAYGGRLDL